MKVFVGCGYNDRDSWIEKQVLPILCGMGFTVVDGNPIRIIRDRATKFRLDTAF